MSTLRERAAGSASNTGQGLVRLAASCSQAPMAALHATTSGNKAFAPHPDQDAEGLVRLAASFSQALITASPASSLASYVLSLVQAQEELHVLEMAVALHSLA